MGEAPFRLHFERSGGVAGLGVRADVDSTQLAEPDATQLRQLLDQVDLDAPAAPPRGADRFQYDLTVDRDGQSRSITAYDGSMAPPLQALTDWLMAFARRSRASQ